MAYLSAQTILIENASTNRIYDVANAFFDVSLVEEQLLRNVV